MVLVTGMAAPLAGIRVLEVANWLAAPAAGALMADLGADVVKVEPPEGDVFRGYRMTLDGLHARSSSTTTPSSATTAASAR